MKILLINPNRYHDPPVMPLGLEYLAGAVFDMATNYQRVKEQR